MRTTLQDLVAWIAWPGLLAACIVATAIGFSFDRPQVGFYLTYAALAAALSMLERWMPHEEAWLNHDGELSRDIGHTALSTGAVQGMLAFSAMVAVLFGLSWLGGPSRGLWPDAWPLACQVLLGLVALEFALYWAHRLAHQWPSLWHFHAVHHSVTRLWAINNGRFHFVDAVKSVLPGIALLILLGAPANVLTWLSALGAYIGILTHCNVAMRFGPLSVVFNTPELHRWHHSKDLREGNKNYGESLMIWDWVFGTWFNASHRPPADIGISEDIPGRFWGQIVWPFQRLAFEHQTTRGRSSSPSGSRRSAQQTLPP